MTGKIQRFRFLALLLPVVAVCSCFVPQVYDSTDHRLISLKPDDLSTQGIAFLTPSTITGQEEEKQAVALLFSEVLKKERPAIRCVGLPETLNALNTAGLADEYKRMLDDYRGTGIFNRDTLQKVGEVTKTGYVANLKLMSFVQGSAERFGAFGLRLVGTKSAHVRLFFQIWNTKGGFIAWEGVQEMHYAVDTVTENSITLKTAIGRTAHEIIAQLP